VYTVHPNVLQEGYEAAFIHLTAPTNHTTKAQKRKDPGLFELIKKSEVEIRLQTALHRA